MVSFSFPNLDTLRICGKKINGYTVNSFVCVVTDELRNALPDMVVDILQEKLTQKLSKDVDRLPVTSSESVVESTNSSSASHSSDSMTNPRCEEGLYEFPKNWVPMDDTEVS